MKILKHIARIVIGITFIFSGFVKGIDPWGFAYKMTDYFNAMDIGWLTWSAFPLSFILTFAEFLIGVTCLFCIRIRFFSWGALLFMLFFTPFTLWTAITNPVSDCGCFGDALVISNWATFYKNVVLLFFAVVLFLERKNIKPFTNCKTSLALGGLFIAVYIVCVTYSYRHEPIIDFRPYKVGVNIPEAMKVPQGAPQDVYQNIMYYRNTKTNKVEKFSEENYPWQDTINWKFEKMTPKLIQKGFEPPIKEFRVETDEGENIYDFFVYDNNYVFMLIAHDLDKSSRKNQDKINELAAWAQNEGYSFICLTSSLSDDCHAFKSETDAPYDFFHADEIALKTMIRSNPGLMVLKDGTIIAKYHSNDIPSFEKFQNEFLKK